MADSDGGHVWPSRASDLRIQELTGAGIEASKPGDVFAALRGAGYAGSLDDMWKQHLAAKGITDTSEPFTDSIATGGGGNGGSAVGSDIDLFQTEPTLATPDNHHVTGSSDSEGFWMNAAGTRLYYANDSLDQLAQMTLSTPYLISSAGVAAHNGDDIGRPFDVWLNADESKIYVAGTGAIITEYNLDTPGDITSLSAAVDTFDASGTITSTHGIFIKPDGRKIFVSGATQMVAEITLATPWNLSTGSITDTLVTDGYIESNGVGWGLTLDPSGTRLYIADTTDDEIGQYNLSTPWDLSTAAEAAKIITLTGGAVQPNGIFMHPDGNGDAMYGHAQAGGDHIFQLDLAS